MYEQLSIFDINPEEKQKPPLNSIVYFVSCGKVIRAIVIDHYVKDMPRCFKVSAQGNKIWILSKAYKSRAEAIENEIIFFER